MAGVHLMALAPRVHLSSSAPSRLGRTALMVSASSLQNHRPLLLQQQHLRSPDLVELEYADLKLKEKVGEVGHVRIRQHVNPLSASFSTSPEIPNWDGVFEDPKLPLMVDIGSGSGRFLMWLAKKHPQSRNYLGLEIREKLVKRAQFWVKELSLKNICFQGAGFCLPRSFNVRLDTVPRSTFQETSSQEKGATEALGGFYTGKFGAWWTGFHAVRCVGSGT
ncbi:uncharacterized protein LOC116253703 isoform X4 [Nymphaea colorata]|uniref:uncharacterized protein LOC116253703 isoform X4 n=1 Tax=Nymphaea colorata TaxID=210225 RepID=UPI00129D771D|nr:uncharacterized protein LOC116253703 isoform X4 [Nymphaea colorata]